MEFYRNQMDDPKFDEQSLKGFVGLGSAERAVSPRSRLAAKILAAKKAKAASIRPQGSDRVAEMA